MGEGVKKKDGELFLSLCSFSSSQCGTSGPADLTAFLPPPQLFFFFAGGRRDADPPPSCLPLLVTVQFRFSEIEKQRP